MTFLKRFVKRTYAVDELVFHDGGTWAALRDTQEPPAPDCPDWTLVADGLAGFHVTFGDDMRSITVETRTTSGRRHVSRMSVAVVLDRGVFTKAKNYDPGDGVTYDGGFWICQKASPGVPGEPSNGWRLAVRRGRDGKSAKDERLNGALQSGDVRDGCNLPPAPSRNS
ncbi:hypothetical protein [Cupriavidus oxalaticus]|uniref:Uncharacterized protein n=1 Tax=Cupriavidus oxalaticus TaxID=96344 RepID=A0A5P3VH73_9BURK|nr:hypothetical protein [Cupriavidus oxalaticus]QEZ45697.1 hypothetical protein D2917_15330 [Cupriavidus oxalaticus]